MKTKTKPKKDIKKNSKKSSTKKKKNIKKRRIIAIIILIIILITIFTLILLSDLFNIRKITVINNNTVSTEEIIQNSHLSVGNNMFKTLKITTKRGIEKNPYIEAVKVKRKLDGEIIIDVEERIPTYMLQTEDGYAYINNQGYILEISQTVIEVPSITGYETQEIIPGNRISKSDLKKLEIIIQIMETAKNNKISDIMTSIDIADENNFIIAIPSENKTVQFGDKTNINMKILWIVDLINKEKGVAGEIVVNVPNIKKVYFREKV